METKPGHPAEDHSTLKQRAAAASIVASTVLAALKLAAGFASGSLGNLITVDDERRKLELVASTAARVWG